jgi:hypothetical protein
MQGPYSSALSGCHALAHHIAMPSYSSWPKDVLRVLTHPGPKTWIKKRKLFEVNIYIITIICVALVTTYLLCSAGITIINFMEFNRSLVKKSSLLISLVVLTKRPTCVGEEIIPVLLKLDDQTI